MNNIDQTEDRVAKMMLLQFIVSAIIVILALSGFGVAGYIILFFLYTTSFYVIKTKTIILNQSSQNPSVRGLVIKGTEAVIFGVLFLITLTCIFLFFKTNLMVLFIVPNSTFQHTINFLNFGIGAVIGIVAGYINNKISTRYEKVITEKYNSQIINS